MMTAIQQLIEDTLPVLCLSPGLATAPMLYACDEHPDLLALVRRNFVNKGDLDTVSDSSVGQHDKKIEAFLLRLEIIFKTHQALSALRC